MSPIMNNHKKNDEDIVASILCLLSPDHADLIFDVYESVSVGEWIHKISLLKDFSNKYRIPLPKDLAMNFAVLCSF